MKTPPNQKYTDRELSAFPKSGGQGPKASVERLEFLETLSFQGVLRRLREWAGTSNKYSLQSQGDMAKVILPSGWGFGHLRCQNLTAPHSPIPCHSWVINGRKMDGYLLTGSPSTSSWHGDLLSHWDIGTITTLFAKHHHFWGHLKY